MFARCACTRLAPLVSPSAASWRLHSPAPPPAAARALHGTSAVPAQPPGGIKSVFELFFGTSPPSASHPHLPSPASSPPSSDSSSARRSSATSLPSTRSRPAPPATASNGIFHSFLSARSAPSSRSSRSAGATDPEEERLSRERNIETAKALERTLRSTRGTGYGGGGGAGGTIDLRTTTVDSKGTVTTTSAALSKQELCAKFGIPPRDLRKLDSAVPTVVPTILSRKSCIILTILHLRCVITAREVVIFDSVGSEDSWLKGVLVWSLEHALKTTTKAAHGLPYEFRALEACLVNVLTALETDLVNIRSHVVELLAHMEEHIDRDNLRLLLTYNRKLSVFQKRAALVQECLDELLANDADLAAMYLTSKVQGRPRTAEDHEEVELLLESFSKQCEEITSEVETLSANVRHTEDIVELILDANRNSLLGLDLRVSIATLGLTAGAMVAALFGMLTSHLEETPFAFPAITLFTFAAALFVTTVGLRRLSRLRKVNLGYRDSSSGLGAAGGGGGLGGQGPDRWGRGAAKRLGRGARRRD